MKRTDYYEEDAHKTHVLSPHARVRAEIIASIVGLGKHVLDVGAGEGDIATLLAQKENTVVCVDIASHAVRKLSARGFKTYQLDVEKDIFPFRRNSFDIVIAGEIIEHLFDPLEFLRKCSTVLKKGGLIVVTTPNLASLGRRILLLIGKNPYTDPWVEKAGIGGHIRYYVPATLTQVLSKAGFIAISMTSDIVKFDVTGRLYSRTLAQLFPNIGWGLIAVGRKPG